MKPCKLWDTYHINWCRTASLVPVSKPTNSLLTLGIHDFIKWVKGDAPGAYFQGVCWSQSEIWARFDSFLRNKIDLSFRTKNDFSSCFPRFTVHVHTLAKVQYRKSREKKSRCLSCLKVSEIHCASQERIQCYPLGIL